MKKVLIALLSIFIASSLFANEKNVFAKVTTSVFLDSKGTNSIGRVDVATPLKLLEKNDAFYKVELTGWSAEGSEIVLFKKMGQRVIYALLDESVISTLKKLDTKLDDFDTQWNKNAIVFWIAKDSIAFKLNEVLNKGKDLFESRCGACHAAPDLHHYTVNQWPGVIGSMKDRAGLSENELQIVVKYVQNNSK